jgi:WD40 repeat protein
VRAAFTEGLPERRRNRFGGRLAVAVALCALGLIVALTPAGARVADFVENAVQPGEHRAQPALTSLPGGGELVVESPTGPWVVNADGSKRLLGDYRAAAWSPHGLFVAVASGHELSAVEPTGDVHWSISSSRHITRPAWSTSGVRVAYLSGDSLRIVAGDGSEDRLLAPHVAAVAPAWRPQTKPLPPDGVATGRRTNLLAYATAEGRVEVVDVDAGKVLFRSPAAPEPEGLSWSSNGQLLLSFTRHGLRTYDFASRERFPTAAGMPEGSVLRAASFEPDGNRVAAIETNTRASRPRSTVLLGRPDVEAFLSERLYSKPGRFTDLAWSPGGDRLLVGWRDADQWVFLNPARPGNFTSVGNISRQFSPGTTSPSAFPGVAGWCCTASGTSSP